jgi:hypothetical protein
MRQRGNRLFIYRPMFEALVQETNAHRASSLILLLDKLASSYSANIIKDKKIAEIAEHTGINHRHLRSGIPLLEKAGMIKREFTTHGKRTITIISQRKLGYNDTNNLIVINKDDNDITDRIIIEYTKNLLQAQMYKADKASDYVNRGNTRKRKNNVVAKNSEDTYAKVTDIKLSQWWNCGLRQANAYKRELMARGLLNAVIIVKFLCVATKGMQKEINNHTKGHGYISDGKAYDKLGTVLSFEKTKPRKGFNGRLPYCKTIIINSNEQKKT